MNLDIQYSAVNKNGEVAELSLKDIFSFGEKTLLFFYPRDNTPGCTVENKDFSCMLKEFQKLWIVLIWVSKDSIESHQKFIEKQDLQIDLISDPDLVLHKELWAFGEKNNYGKIVQWVIRSTFLFDKNGNLTSSWSSMTKPDSSKVLEEINNVL